MRPLALALALALHAAPAAAEITGKIILRGAGGGPAREIPLGTAEESRGGEVRRVRYSALKSPAAPRFVLAWKTPVRPSLPDLAAARLRKTAEFALYSPQGEELARADLGERFRGLALSADASRIAVMDLSYEDVEPKPGDTPEQMRALDPLRTSRLYVMDRSWKVLFSTSTMEGGWQNVAFSPSGTWLLFESLDSCRGTIVDCRLCAADLRSGKVHSFKWSRQAQGLAISDSGRVTGREYAGTGGGTEKVNLPGGAVKEIPRALFRYYSWKPGEKVFSPENGGRPRF